MLDAASGILENLTAGVVQKIPGLHLQQLRSSPSWCSI
jgi:hypothetical protein